MSFPSKSGHPRYRHQAHRQISDKHDALVVKMFDNANSQNRERNLPKTWFRSAPNALFGEKHDLAPQGRLVCTAKGTCSGLRKALITQQTRLVFHIIHTTPDTTLRQSSTETILSQRITTNRPFSGKTFHDTVSCPAPPFSAIRNPHPKANIRQEKSRKTVLSAPHTRLLEAQTRRKARPTPKASVGGVKTEVIGS